MIGGWRWECGEGRTGERESRIVARVPFGLRRGMVDEENCKILVFSRHGVYKSEQELINLVKERIEK